MVERKSRVLAFSWAFLLWSADAMASVFNNSEEWQLLKTRGYRGNSGFAKVRSDVVRSCGLELIRLDPENRHIEGMQLYLRRILGDINYPIGHGKLECGISGYWNILVEAEGRCVKAANRPLAKVRNQDRRCSDLHKGRRLSEPQIIDTGDDIESEVELFSEISVR